MDRMSSIELAINNEKSEMHYYLEQAKRSSNPVAKLLFETLAADESEHMKRIRVLHEKLTSAGSWPEDLPIEVAGTDIIGQISNLMNKKDTSSEHDNDDLEALRKAAEGEAQGAKFYADLAEACTNPQEKKFFQFLSGIEREHLLSIKDSLFYLEDPEGWLEEKSHAGLDGA